MSSARSGEGPIGPLTITPRHSPDLTTMLAAIVRDAMRDVVRDELDALRQDVMKRADAPAPALLDRASLARELGVSTAQVTRLKERGMPWIRVGEVPRYRLADVLQWLRAQGPEGSD